MFNTSRIGVEGLATRQATSIGAIHGYADPSFVFNYFTVFATLFGSLSGATRRSVYAAYAMEYPSLWTINEDWRLKIAMCRISYSYSFCDSGFHE